MNLILLGAPGAGKGTLAASLIEKMGVPSISTGNILREAIAKNTPLGQSAKQYMDKGELVPDKMAIGMLKDRIAQSDCANGFILDGFPRTIPQAEALDEVAGIDCVLSIEVPDAVIEGRMTGRRVCPRCGATFHIVNMPPKVADVCDACGDNLIVRKDDAVRVVRDRLKNFHAQTEPLKNYYAAQNKLMSIDGTKAIREVLDSAAQALGLLL